MVFSQKKEQLAKNAKDKGILVRSCDLKPYEFDKPRCAKPIASGGHQSRPRERAPAQDRVRMRTPSPARSPTPTGTQRSGSRRAEKALDIPVDQPSKGASLDANFETKKDYTQSKRVVPNFKPVAGKFNDVRRRLLRSESRVRALKRRLLLS